MKKSASKYLALLSIIITLSACASGIDKKPWIDTIPIHDSEYLYFVGIKTGAPTLEEGKRSAVKAAIAELVEYFEVNLQSKYLESTTTLETRILLEIEAVSKSVSIKEAGLKDWQFEKTDKGVFDVYVLIQYPRAAFEAEKRRIQTERHEKKMQIKKAIEDGQKAELNGDISAAYSFYVFALKLSKDTGDELPRTEALAYLREMMSSIRLDPVSGDGQTAEPFKGLKESLIVKLSLDKKERAVPIPRISIDYSFIAGEGDIAATALTDRNGLADCKVSAIRGLDKNYRVEAALNTGQLFPIPSGLSKEDTDPILNYIELLKSKKATFNFISAKAKKDVRVVILVDEENLGRPSVESIVGNELSAMLVDAGYRVIADHEIGKTNMDKLKAAISRDDFFSLKSIFYQMADMVVTGTVKTREGSKNMGMAISSNADAYIRAINLKTGEVIAQKNITGIAGFGDSKERAGINALRKAGQKMAEGIIEGMAQIQ